MRPRVHVRSVRRGNRCARLRFPPSGNAVTAWYYAEPTESGREDMQAKQYVPRMPEVLAPQSATLPASAGTQRKVILPVQSREKRPSVEWYMSKQAGVGDRRGTEAFAGREGV